MILKSAIYTCHEHPCVFRIGVSYPPPTHPPTYQGKSGVDAQELTHSLHA